jgi:hypothetical protein
MDKALMDRFTIVEMDVLDTSQELELLQYMFPHVDVSSLTAVAEIANTTRVESNSETGKIDTAISTRSSVEMAGLIFDGFGLDEAAQVSVYPQFSNDGGVDSERTFVKQLVQKYINDGSGEDLFNVEDIDDEYDKRIYDFLLDHPFITANKHYELIDTKANIKKQATSILKSAEAVQVATTIKDNELSDLRKLFGIGEGFDDEIVKAKLIQMAGQAPDRFLQIYKDADKSYRVFLKKALDKKVIQKVNDVWKHNNYTLGISDEHAIAWLKENSDVYAIMKNQVRGNADEKSN